MNERTGERLPRRRVRGGMAFGVLAACGLLAMMASRAAGSPAETISLVPAGTGSADVTLTGQTYSAVKDVLATTGPTDLSIELPPIPGFAEPITGIADVVVTPDDGNAVLALTTSSGQILSSLTGGVLQDAHVEVLLVIDWADGGLDTAPSVVLALRVNGQTVAELYSGWAAGGLPGMPDVDDSFELASAVLAFASETPLVLDPAHLPDVVDDFLELTESRTLDRVASLIGVLDETANEPMYAIAEFLGIDPNDLLEISGSLADSAAQLFDDDPDLVDPADFSLDGPFELSSSDLPDWLNTGLDLPEFQFRLGPAPDRTPTVTVQDGFDIVTGAVTNHFEYDVSLQEGKDLDLEIAAPTFNVPYGLEWMGPFTDVELHLFVDDSTDTIAAEFSADVPITTPSPRVHIAVKQAAAGSSGDVRVDGSIPLDDLVAWAGGSSAFPGDSFTTSALDTVSLDDLELHYDAAPGGNNLSLFADASGIQVFEAGLDVTVLGAMQDTPTTSPVFLFAVRVVDPACNGGTCIKLHQALDIGSTSLAGDLTVPAVNFALVQPQGAHYDPTPLSPDAAAFLGQVLGTTPADPVVLAGDLELSTAIPLTDLADPLDAVGITISPAASLRIEGSLGVTLEDFATLQLQTFELTAQFPGASFTVPAGLPDWIGPAGSGAALEWSTDPWTAFLRFAENDGGTDADDLLELGATLPGIKTTLVDTNPGTPAIDPLTFSAEVAFAGTPASNTWTASFRGAMGQWQEPLGIEFLTIDGAELLIEFSESAGQPVTPHVLLAGDFSIGTEPDTEQLRVEIGLTGTDPLTASVTVGLETEITVDDLLMAVFRQNFGAPVAVTSAGVGPGSITLSVTSEGTFTLGGTISAGFSPFEQRIGACAMFLAQVSPTEATPKFAIGVQLEPLKLSALMPASLNIPEQFDLDIVTQQPSCGDDQTGPDDSGFGFVFNKWPGLDPDDPALPGSVRDWFAPLFGGAPGSGDTVDEDLSALGAFSLPDGLAELVRGIGIRPNVLLSGNIPLPIPDGSGGFSFDDVGINFGLGLRVDPAVLPDFVDDAGLNLKAGVDGGGFFVRLEGFMIVRFKQGMEPAMTDALNGVGLELPTANPVPDGHVCPRGGFREPGWGLAVAGTTGAPLNLPLIDQIEGQFCYDKLQLTLGGEIVFLPPKIQMTLDADLSVLNAPVGSDFGWAPLGFDQVIIRQLGGQVTFALDPTTTPYTIEVKLGLLGNMQVLGRNMSGAIQAGVKIDPVVIPPKPPTFVPIFDGLRISFPDGIGTGDIVDIYNALEEGLRAAAGTPESQPRPDISALVNSVPDFELRNLFFSLSPFGVQSLCIDQGLVLRGDLYIDPTAPAMLPEGTCNRNTGIIEVPPDPPEGSPLCVDRKDEGCFAGVNFSLTPAGLVAQGSISGFDVAPFHWEDSYVDLKLTLLEQYLKMRGGVSLDLPNGDAVGGRMTLDMRPLEIKYYGHLENMFGFDATVDGSSSIDFAQLFDGQPPGDMNLRVVLASKAFDVGPGPDGVHHDFVADLEGQVDEVLGQLQDALQDISDFIIGVIQDPVGTLTDLVQNLQEIGVTSGLPPWMTDIVADIAEWIELATKAGDSLSINDILNGPKIDGVESFYFPEGRTCVQTVLGVPLVTIEVDPDTLEVTVELTEGTLDDDGNCWTIEPTAFTFGLPGQFVEPVCVGLENADGCWLLPPVEFPQLGLCDTLDIEPCDVDALIDAEFMPLMSQVLDDVIVSFGDVTEADVAALITNLNQFLEGDPLFQLRCAEFDLALGGFDETELALGLELVLGGQALGAGVTWNFDDFDGSIESLIGVLFAEFESFTCSTLPHYVTEDSSVTGNIAGEPGAPPVAPPANLTITRTPGTVDEDSSVTVNGTFDRPLETSGVVTIDWGDGEQTTVPVGAGATTLPAQTHLYIDDDPTGTKKDLFTIAASIDTGGNGDSVSVWIRNVNPVITNLTVTPDTIVAIDEGASVQLGLTFTDVGVEDTHTVLVTWGDGSAPQSFAPGDPMTHTYLDDNPTVTTHDPYLITVKVADDDTGSTTSVREVDVRNVPPSNVAMTWTDPVNEGALVALRVTFTDPGLGDTHQVQIDWDGDANGFDADTTRSVPPGRRVLNFNHRFRDDHPSSGTPFDVIMPAVRVVDDDSGESEVADEAITVYNVAPSIVEANVVTTPSSVAENHEIVLTGAFTDPGLPDSHTVTIDWGDGSTDTVLSLRVGRRDFDATHRYLDDHPSTGTAQDDFTVTMAVTDDDTGTDSATKVVTVRNVNPALTVDTTGATGTAYNPSTGELTISVQYSDPIAGNTPFTVIATDVVGDPLTIAVESNGTTGSAAFAALLAGTLDQCTVDAVDSNIHHCAFAVGSVPNPSTGIYTDIAPGTYSVNVVVRDNDDGTTTIPVSVTVLPEDARVYYHGAYFAATAPNSTSVPVELRSTVRDITGVPGDPAYDPWPGDIRQATVRWVDRDPAPDTPLCPAPVDRPVDAVFVDFSVFDFAKSIGVAACSSPASLGTANARDYSVGTVVDRYYTRNDGDDDLVVTVVRPQNEFITGGGYVVPTQSAGTYASTPGSHANFGFNVKFNKRNTNLQGAVNLIVRSGGRVYQIKSNSISTLGVVVGTAARPGTAQFESKANITDITDPNNPIVLQGNLNLQMRLTDASQDGSLDTISLSLWGPKKGNTQLLLYSSKWSGNVTIEQPLVGGNLSIH